MTSIALKCDAILEELYKFSEDIIYLGEPISDNRQKFCYRVLYPRYNKVLNNHPLKFKIPGYRR